MAPKLILTGFMATGKSAVARAVAQRLGWRLLDCDELIVARRGQPIAQIFRDHGEAHFRMLERNLIAEIAGERRHCALCGNPRPAVVATGGGAIVDPQNFAALNRAGVVICLIARPEVIARRIGPAAASRPLLTEGGKPLAVRIGELIEARRAAYARAPVTIDTSDLSVRAVAEATIAAYALHGREKWAASA
ncbi:MAG: shikimate kinase [Candidatus Binataceae bacterium]|nr:shikimate kinase [Candidatus Binataceae bacterium]